MKQTLVTGGTGFVGHYVVKELACLGEVISLVRKKQHPADFVFDLTSPPASIDRAKLPTSVDAVVHLAALTQKTKNDSTPPQDYQAQNVVGTTHLLELLESTMVSHFIYVSTLDVYGDTKGKSITEKITPNPQSPYARSKYTAEQLCATWAARRGVPLCIVRLGLVYGPGEEAYEKVIPQYIRMALNGQALVVYGKSDITRDFIYVADAARAIRILIENKATGVYNIASGNTVTIAELARYINKLTGNTAGIITSQPVGAQTNISFDTTKLRRLEFAPKTSFTKGLLQEILWFQKHV